MKSKIPEIEIKAALERLLAENEVTIDKGKIIFHKAYRWLLSDKLGMSRQKAKFYVGHYAFFPKSIIHLSAQKIPEVNVQAGYGHTLNPWSDIFPPTIFKQEINEHSQITPHKIVQIMKTYAKAVDELGVKLDKLSKDFQDKDKAYNLHAKIVDYFDLSTRISQGNTDEERANFHFANDIYHLLRASSRRAFRNMLEFVFVPDKPFDLDLIVSQAHDLLDTNLAQVPDYWSEFNVY